MRVIIPVAGLGKRFLPITNTIQKCLMPVAGYPILYHILHSLNDIQSKEICLIIGHLGDQVKEFCREYAKDFNVDIIVENHNGLSSNPKLLVEVIKSLDFKNCGTLPDFGNWCIAQDEEKRNELYALYQRGKPPTDDEIKSITEEAPAEEVDAKENPAEEKPAE